jgi:hypothetical protein
MTNWNISDVVPRGLPAPIDPDRGGYTVTMRENAGAEETLALLDDAGGAEGGRLHVGWGSFRNLDIAAARGSAWVLLLDINLHQFRVWDAVRAALASPEARDAASFVDAVVPLLPHTPRLRQFSSSTRDWLMADADRAGSWLFRGAPERFARISRLFREGRVATACVDVRGAAGGGAFPHLAAELRRAASAGHALPDTLYVSNLPWMLAQREAFFGEGDGNAPEQDEAAALAQVHANLSAIAGDFRHVISASHLAASSQPGDLQWCTEALAPQAFLAADYWSALKPVDGPFRTLR